MKGSEEIFPLLDTPSGVIAKLKTVAQSDMARRIPGLSGSMLDDRTDIVLQSDAEAATAQPRLYWSEAKKRFEIATSGPPGIKALVLKDAPVATHVDNTNRSAALYYAKESTWVWDYTASAKAGPLAPSTISTTDVAPTAAPSHDPSEGYPAGPAANALQPPLFSQAPGTYSILDYPFELYLANPNPSGSSNIQYSVDFGPWQTYSVSIPGNSGYGYPGACGIHRHNPVAQQLYRSGHLQRQQ